MLLIYIIYLNLLIISSQINHYLNYKFCFSKAFMPPPYSLTQNLAINRIPTLLRIPFTSYTVIQLYSQTILEKQLSMQHWYVNTCIKNKQMIPFFLLLYFCSSTVCNFFVTNLPLNTFPITRFNILTVTKKLMRESYTETL